MFQHLAVEADDEYAIIDATIILAHQHRAGAQGGDPKTEAIGTRYDKRAVHFLGASDLAAAVIWLN